MVRSRQFYATEDVITLFKNSLGKLLRDHFFRSVYDLTLIKIKGCDNGQECSLGVKKCCEKNSAAMLGGRPDQG